MKNEHHTALYPWELLLPRPGTDLTRWACVACDQYTSQPEYWEAVKETVGDAPSTLNLMLPECWLGEAAQRVPAIHQAMAEAQADGLLQPALPCGMILVERTTASGSRLGLVAAVDLEQYDYAPGSRPPVRPTEQTIAERLPPRLAIRRGAPLELSHILMLLDDPARTVIEPLYAARERLRPLYDFGLMQGGGHLRGWAIESPEDLADTEGALQALQAAGGEHPLLFAVGDGNHSLATAKAAWEEIKPGLSPSEQKNHPARYALCEVENIHDEALQFEPIHRVLTHVDASALLADWESYAAARGMALAAEAEQHVTLVSAGGERTVGILHPDGAIAVATVQRYLDDYLARHPEAGIDFIHGEDVTRRLGRQPGAAGILLPPVDKGGFFPAIQSLGVLPRKTFSMGHAEEKRFYLEAKRIL